MLNIYLCFIFKNEREGVYMCLKCEMCERPFTDMNFEGVLLVPYHIYVNSPIQEVFAVCRSCDSNLRKIVGQMYFHGIWSLNELADKKGRQVEILESFNMLPSRYTSKLKQQVLGIIASLEKESNIHISKKQQNSEN